MTHYGMAIDLNRCVGCQTCAAACKVANNNPIEMVYSHVDTIGGKSTDCAGGTYEKPELDWLPFQCQHCAEPQCVAVCPTGASQQRDDGIIIVASELCIGCESCMRACPYQERGVRTHLSAEPKYYLDVVVGEFDCPPHKGGTVEKCMFCYNLIDRGEVPACMQLCLARARYWGDLDDPNSEISKVIASRNYKLLNEEAGTKPSVYYLTK